MRSTDMRCPHICSRCRLCRSYHFLTSCIWSVAMMVLRLADRRAFVHLSKMLVSSARTESGVTRPPVMQQYDATETSAVHSTPFQSRCRATGSRILPRCPPQECNTVLTRNFWSYNCAKFRRAMRHRAASQRRPPSTRKSPINDPLFVMSLVKGPTRQIGRAHV